MKVLTAWIACLSDERPVDSVTSSELRRHLQYPLEPSAGRACDLIVLSTEDRSRL